MFPVERKVARCATGTPACCAAVYYLHLCSIFNRLQLHDGLCPSCHCPQTNNPHTQVCALTNPIWLMKTRLALQQRGSMAAAGGAYRGIADAFVRIGRAEGLAGYYKGFGPSLVLVRQL